jgi:hypothetical protein
LYHRLYHLDFKYINRLNFSVIRSTLLLLKGQL